jgi:hypothetical protein
MDCIPHAGQVPEVLDGGQKAIGDQLTAESEDPL